MDLYDPQTLGIMVFGGFMVISAVGIALVSTFSMKETSYEEALAKQRRELGKPQSARAEKKKKDKVSEKKKKKKEDKPNGKIPEPEINQEDAEVETVIESTAALVVTAAPQPALALEDKPAPAAISADNQSKTAADPNPAHTEPSPALSSKEKKKKKVAKVEPAATRVAPLMADPAPLKSSEVSALNQAPESGQSKSAPATSKNAPASAKSALAPAPASTKTAPAPASTKTAPAPASTKTAPAAAPASTKSAPAAAPASTKTAPAAAPASTKSAPAAAPASTKSAPASAKSAPAAAPAASAKSAPAAAPAASAKSAPAAAPAASTKSAPAASTKSAPAASTRSPPAASTRSPPAASTKSAPAAAATRSAATPAKSATPTARSQASSKIAPVLEAITKDVPVMAVPPVGSQQAHVVEGKAQESKKKASKKKSEPVAAVDSADAALYLPYKALVSTIRSMVFSEEEGHRLIEILAEKAGIVQDSWQMATQKGDPVVILKKQLEEREKQLAAEQEDASAVKNRLRELTKELSAEKSKVASVETRLSSQLSKREQEIIALQARMQASYQDHVAQTQSLNSKILSLQDQLEKGPNAQLARLQQENSILRDALNQATSQAESKQNAELAKLRQECTKLTKELGEKTESLLADEHIRKGLEAKLSATEKQLSVLQTSHSESEQALQKRLEEVGEELRLTQSQCNTLQTSLDKTQQDRIALTECQSCIGKLEADIKDRSAQVEALTSQLEEIKTEKSQLSGQLATINSLLEASQNNEEEEKSQGSAVELEQLRLTLQERDKQLSTVHDELTQLQNKHKVVENTIIEQEQRNKSENANLVTSLQDELNNLKEEMAQLKNTQSDSSTELRRLQNSLTEKDVLVTSLQEELKEKKNTGESALREQTAFQTEIKETLHTLFPQISVETEQSNWVQVFMQKAQEALNQQSQESQSNAALPELLEKLKEAEENHGSLQAECEQYRTVLAETEGMLKHLQKSVEEEELVWKSKMANSEEQLRLASEKVRKLESENQSIVQVKEQIMLLEAQLEKQSDEGLSEEMEQLKLQLLQCQSQLDMAQKEAQAHKEELAQVREQLGQITMQAQQEQNGLADAQPSQVQNELTQKTEKLHGEVAQKLQLSEEYEQAQKTITELQVQLDLMKDSPQADTEDVVQLKERLEKEKKLSKDLGQAATKLQQLLRSSQEQLTKERETMRTLQEHLQGKGEIMELKEGTSV